MSDPVRKEPATAVDTALDVALDAATRILKDRLAPVDVDLVIVARLAGPLVADNNDGRDSCLASSLEAPGDDEELIRGILERALKALGP